MEKVNTWIKSFTYVGDRYIYFVSKRGNHFNLSFNPVTGNCDRRIYRIAGYSYFKIAGYPFPFFN